MELQTTPSSTYPQPTQTASVLSHESQPSFRLRRWHPPAPLTPKFKTLGDQIGEECGSLLFFFN